MPANGHEIYSTDDEVIAALFLNGGNVSRTAKTLKLKNINELRVRINSNPVLTQAKVEAGENLKDIAEATIATSMRKSPRTAEWYLTHKAKERGYGDVITNVNMNMDVDKVYDFSALSLEEKKKLLEVLSGTNASQDTE